MKNPMRKGITFLMAAFIVAAFVAALLTMASGAATARTGNTCVYANDNVNWFTGPNTVDGYLVTTTSQTYLAPVETGSKGSGYSVVRNIVVSSTRSILYVSDSHKGDVAAMKIDPATCQLTLLGNYPVTGFNRYGMGLAASPNGRWLYVTGVDEKTLYLLDVRPDGSLSHVRQTVALRQLPSNMAVTPDGATLVLGYPRGKDRINQALSYSIDPSTGMLTLVSTVVTHGSVDGLAIDSQSKFVYVNETSGQYLRIAVLEIGPGSTMTLNHIYNVPQFLYRAYGGDALLSVNGKYLYVSDLQGGLVATFSVDASSGTLRYEAQTSFAGAVGLATSKTGAFLFSANGAFSGDFGIFSASQDGTLTSLGTFPTSNLGYPAWVAAKTF